jgi:lysine 2,3-aminomutase
MRTQYEINQQFEKIHEQYQLLPIKVTPFFQKKIDEEILVLGHHEGPLHRMAYPSQERLEVRDGQEVQDFVEDRSNMPDEHISFIIQKYDDRVLFLPTENCAGHCQYCFRQNILTEQVGRKKLSIAKQVDILKDYLSTHPKANEVILSGGDPMTLPLNDLKLILEALCVLPQLISVRIHTKTLTYSPHVFKSEDKLKLLAHPKIRLVFHITHPYEICDEVNIVLKRIQSFGIKCYNQFPLLRNINDHAELLIQHLRQLDELHVRNLSIFVPEPVFYSTAFRIPLKRVFAMIDDINWHSPSWINATRFVLDSSIGKVRREDLKHYDEKNNKAIFEREGQSVVYPDLPAHLDKAGGREILLWKEV